jgi:hypothetical protein
MAAQFMIDMILDDGPGGDLALAYLSGGDGVSLPGFGGPYDAAAGLFIGGGAAAIANAQQYLNG